MHVIQHVPRRIQRRMNLPSERMVVNGVGLGEVDGLFNIGKMFSRMIKITPSSFKLKNVFGAIGSVAMFGASGGLSSLAPKLTGAHSKLSKGVGMAVVAAGAVVGGGLAIGAIGGTTATGTGLTAVGTASSGSATIGTALGTSGAATGGGIFSAIGSGLSTVGSGFMTAMKALPILGTVMGGGGGVQQQQQGGMTQAEYDAQQKAAYDAGQQQAAYDTQVRAQQSQMYMPGMVQDVSYMGAPSIGQPGTMQTSYGDLRSPYTAVTEDGQQVQVDPVTGQIMQPGMSTEIMIGIAALALIGGVWYMSDSKNNS